MADEGLHEIQLNGKQLVFLFMASTVVAVVIFLCGVMVGRGVRAQRPAEAVEASVDAATDPTASTPAPREPAPSSASIPSNAPIAANETLTYPSRLEGQEPVEETLKPGLGARDSGLVAKTAPPKPTNDRRGGPSGPPALEPRTNQEADRPSIARVVERPHARDLQHEPTKIRAGAGADAAEAIALERRIGVRRPQHGAVGED